MCYHIKATISTQLSHEKTIRPMPNLDLSNISNNLKFNYFLVSGFDHPDMFLYHPSYQPFMANWGLIPSRAKTAEKQQQIQNQTLNARIETLMVKASFKNIVNNRAILLIDGFYEHHHFNKKAYPFYIYHKNSEPLKVACLYDFSSENPKNASFSIVTTEANSLIAKIQNKPSQGLHRMPLILDKEMEALWLSEKLFSEDFGVLFYKKESLNLNAYPVYPIIGKNGLGNVPDASREIFYPELQIILKDIIEA
jgi:putative SOS response-associated peptidase YedK